MRFRFMPHILALTLAGPLLAAEGQTVHRHVITATGEKIPYAVHLPPDFDPDLAYPVLLGPGDAAQDAPPGLSWQAEPHIRGWIIVDAPLLPPVPARALDLVLEAVVVAFNVEGGKFHALCWHANCADIARQVQERARRFHSLTGIAASPAPDADIDAPGTLKVRYVDDVPLLLLLEKLH